MKYIIIFMLELNSLETVNSRNWISLLYIKLL